MTWTLFPQKTTITDSDGALDRLNASSMDRANRPIMEANGTTAGYRRLRKGLTHLVDADMSDVKRYACGAASRNCALNERGAGA